ncbi:MAG: tetratricopeptide repeat protein [Elusimicrobia bacterium]|nr:tetratricopeptide repeat protein [Elusimicrobiota bacterium]
MIQTAVLLLALAAPAHADADKASTMHYMKAVLLEHQGNILEALQEYQAAIALDPTSSFLVEQAVETALEAGKPDVALEMAKKLVALDPKAHKSHFLLGNVQWARGDAAGAQAAFEEALKINPKFSEAMLSLGNLLSSQSPKRAREYFEKYLATNPENAAEAHYQLGILEQRDGGLEKAIEHLKNAIAINPDSFQARLTLAQVYEAKKDTDAALGEFLAILDRDPENVALRNHIGEVYFMRGELEKSEEHFRHASNSAADNPTTCLWLAILAEQRGDFNQAAAELAKSAALKDEAALNLRLSYYLTQANRIKEAVRALEEAHKKWPDNDDVAYFLALGYDDLKETDKAADLLKELLKARPDFRDARFQLGALYEKHNRMDDAEREFRALIEQRPNDASSLNYLGYSLSDRGLKLEEAQTMIARAVQIDPTNGAYRDSLGWCYFKQGRNAEAKAELETAIKYLPSDATVWEHLGDVQAALGDGSKAYEAYVRAEGFDRGDRVKKKRADAEAKLSPQDAGAKALELAAAGLKGVVRFGGPCDVSGTVVNRPFHYAGLLRYEAPNELQLEFLGPLFVPIFRAKVKGEDGFEMDPFHLEGVPPEAASDAVYRGLKLVRDFIDGRLFAGRPADLKRGWRGGSVKTADGEFTFQPGGRLRTYETTAQPVVKLSVEYAPDDKNAEGPRGLPTALKLEGRGFKLDLALPTPSARFEIEEPR